MEKKLMSYLTLLHKAANSSLTDISFTVNAPSITDYCFRLDPSWSFNELMNGQLAKKYDFGSQSDKWCSTIELTLDFMAFNSFISFIKNTKGSLYNVTSDLDIFCPNCYAPSTCIISSINDKGYLNSDISTGYRVITLELLAISFSPFTSMLSVIPDIFYVGTWEQNYEYSDNIKVSQIGQTWEYNTWTNDKNNYVVNWEVLSANQANILLNMILSFRANRWHIITSPINLNLSTDVTLDKTNRTLDHRYYIKDFTFSHKGTYYTLSMTLNSDGSRVD